MKGFMHMNGLLFYNLTFWTTFAPLVCFCKSFWKTFSKSFANSERYRNMIARSIFKVWNSPLFQMLFLWLNKSSTWMNFPLSFQEGFEIDTNLNTKWDTNWNFTFTYQLKIRYHLKIYFEANSSPNWNKHLWKFLKWWCSHFALGLILSPPLALSAKNGELESLFTFSSNGKINMSEGSYQLRDTWVTAKGKWYR